MGVELSPPAFPFALPEASPQDTPEALPSPILRCLSRPRYTALRHTAGRSGGCRGPLGARQSPRAKGSRRQKRAARGRTGISKVFFAPLSRERAPGPPAPPAAAPWSKAQSDAAQSGHAPQDGKE